MDDELLISRKEVEAIVGLSRSYLYELIKDNRFPRPRRVGKRAIRFVRSEVDNWVKSRPFA